MGNDKKKKKKNTKVKKPIAKSKEQETIKSIINASKIATDLASKSKHYHIPSVKSEENEEKNEEIEENSELPTKKRKLSKTAMKKGHQILISQFHALQKQMEALSKQRNYNLNRKNEEELKEIDSQIEKLKEQMQSLGGIQTYQAMSLLGEKKSSNSTTTPWILSQIQTLKKVRGFNSDNRCVLLDVGALHFNYKQDWIRCTAIDLNPVAKGIQRQDFLAIQLDGEEEDDNQGLVENFNEENDDLDEVEREIENGENNEKDEEEDEEDNEQELIPIEKKPESYDVICFSLVINFVGDVRKRGKMLLKAKKMLKRGGHMAIILPLPCVENSRYLTEEKLLEMFSFLEFECVSSHHSKKLCYYWLKLSETKKKEEKKKGKLNFPRTLLNPGNIRNNFAIVF